MARTGTGARSRWLRAGAAALCVIVHAVAAGAAPAVGERAPDWTLQRPSGETVRFADDARDRVAVVLFWATWCPYCRALMPHLQAVAEDFAGQPVRFYALNVWEDGDPVAHLRERGYQFDLLLDADAVAGAWGVKGTPGLFVVDRSGRVLYVRSKGTGEREAAARVRRAIDAGLAAEAGS